MQKVLPVLEYGQVLTYSLTYLLAIWSNFLQRKTFLTNFVIDDLGLHWCQFIIATSLFLDLKWQFSRGREWGRERGLPLPLAFHYLIFMIWRACDLNLVMISLLASKCQDFKVEMSFFQPLYVLKLKTSNLKVLAFCCQWRYHYQIQITRSLYHKNQILKC